MFVRSEYLPEMKDYTVDEESRKVLIYQIQNVFKPQFEKYYIKQWIHDRRDLIDNFVPAWRYVPKYRNGADATRDGIAIMYSDERLQEFLRYMTKTPGWSAVLYVYDNEHAMSNYFNNISIEKNAINTEDVEPRVIKFFRDVTYEPDATPEAKNLENQYLGDKANNWNYRMSQVFTQNEINYFNQWWVENNDNSSSWLNKQLNSLGQAFFYVGTAALAVGVGTALYTAAGEYIGASVAGSAEAAAAAETTSLFTLPEISLGGLESTIAGAAASIGPRLESEFKKRVEDMIYPEAGESAPKQVVSVQPKTTEKPAPIWLAGVGLLFLFL